MPTDSPRRPAGWDSIEALLSRLRAEGERFEEFIVQQLSEFDVLHADFENREHWLLSERHDLKRSQLEMEKHRQQFDELRQAIEQDAERVGSDARRLEALQAAHDAAKAELMAEQEVWQGRRAELERALDLDRSAWAEQRAAEQTRLAEERSELTRLREAMPQAAAGDVDGDELRRKLAEARLQIAEMQGREAVLERDLAEARRLKQQVASLEQERSGLEAELESVRRRAAELAEAAAAEKQCLADERAEWMAELRQLRRLLERAASAAADEPCTKPVFLERVPARATVAAAPIHGESDPMLESVMAQFSMLQKDISRRRSSH